MYERSYHRFVESLRSGLQNKLPGIEAQLEMAPVRPGANLRTAWSKNCREAAVLIALYPAAGEPNTILTVRPTHLSTHAGQISFPGGGREGNEELHETALREAEEEINLPATEVDLLGELTPLYIPPTNYCVHPFVGALRTPPALRPCEDEVADILQVPLAELLTPDSRKLEEWVLYGQRVKVPFFLIRGFKVWGATAMILSEFLSVLSDCEYYADHERRTY